MSARIPDDSELDRLLRQLPMGERDNLLWAIDEGHAVLNAEYAALAVAVGRRRLRRTLVLLPVYVLFCVGLSIALGFGVTHSSAGFAFTLLLSGVLVVGWLWWGESWLPRRRSVEANLALVRTGERPVDGGRARSRAHEWWLVVPIAWVASLALGGVAWLVFDAPGWIGLPLFLVSLLLLRRLVGTTVDRIDEWGNR